MSARRTVHRGSPARRHRAAALLASVVLAPAAAVLPRPALAQSAAERAEAPLPRRVARLVAQAGEAYQAGNADEAIRLLERAYEIRAIPTLLFNIARAHELGGRLEVAIDYYSRFLATDPPADAAQTARELRTAAQNTLNERNRPPPPPPPPPPRPPVVVRPPGRPFRAVHGVLIGGGVALGIAGGVLGGLALGASAQFAATSPVNALERAGLQDRGTAYAWSADVGIALGVGLAALGLVLFLAQDPRAGAAPAADANGATGAAR